MPAVAAGNTHVYAQYTIRVPERDKVAARLKALGIPTAVYYPKCLHEQPVFAKLGYHWGDFPAVRKGLAGSSQPAHASVPGAKRPGGDHPWCEGHVSQPADPIRFMLGRNFYYRVKPLVPVSVRRGVRRWFALRKRRKVGDVWPVLPGSERPPAGWPGWPEGKQFALVLTHDVESQAGLERCRRLMELERKWGFRSSFNFIPEGALSRLQGAARRGDGPGLRGRGA